MSTRRPYNAPFFTASLLAPLAFVFGCSSEQNGGTPGTSSSGNSSSAPHTDSTTQAQTSTTTSTGTTGSTSSTATNSGASGQSTSGGSGTSSSGGSGASTSGGSGASTSGGSGSSGGGSNSSDSAGLSTSGSDSSGPAGSDTSDTGGSTEFALTAPWSAKDECTPTARQACDNIPVENRWSMINGTPKGQDVMPTISWTSGPEGTVGYALVFHDLSNGFAHWAMWGIPADVLSVDPDNIPAAATQASFSGDAWVGSGACCNTYELIVYALKEPLDPQGNMKQTALRDQLEDDTTGALVLARDYARVAPLEDCDIQPACAQ